MRLKRLELQGFKSFLDRTILHFEDGITGVVGPNGCGKSNIVDAILWVMGEQSAKHLRGESMSDVIFNGAENKAPTSFAEVSLVMDGEHVSLPPHLLPYLKGDEIVITRRLYRDGTAEYLLNKMACRLKDIHEVFMDTGVGRRAYSVIEQGQIDRMINTKPDDRRLILEEVAGITKYRTKKKEAERKLENTKLNLDRVQDIVNELEKQMRSLKIQSTRARKYKEIKVELEMVDLFVLGRKLHSLKQEIDNFEKDKEGFVTQRAELDAQVGRFEAEVTELDVQRLDEEKVIQNLDLKERELALLVQKLESQMELLGQQKNHLFQSVAAMRGESSELEQKFNTLKEQKNSLHEESQTLESSVNELNERIEAQEAELESSQSRRSQLETEKDDLQTEASELSQKEVYFKNQIQHGEAQREEASERKADLNQKLTELVVILDTMKTHLKEADDKIAEALQRSQSVEQEVSNSHSECQSTSSQLSEKEKEVFDLRESFHQQRSRLHSLEELQENLEGYSPTAKEVLSRLEGSEIHAVPLAEVFRPDAEVESHLEALLGDSINTLLVQSPAQAKELVRLIQERDLERVGILAVEELSPPANFPPDFSLMESQPIALRSKVQVEPGYEKVAEHWLGQVYLCENDAILFDVRERFPSLTLITEDGKTMALSNGLISCGNVPTKTGIFARKREIDELTSASSDLERQVEAKEQERQRLMESLERQEARHAELKDKLSSIHIESVEHRKEREKLQLGLDRADNDYSRLVEDSEKCSAELDEVGKQLDEWKTGLHKTTQDREAVLSSQNQLECELETVQQTLEQAGRQLGERRVERSKLAERFEGIADRLRAADLEASDTEQRLQSIQERIQQAREKETALETESKEVEANKQSSQEQRNELMADLAQRKENHNSLCSRVTDLRVKKDEITKQREDMLESIQEIELKLTQAQSDFEHQKNISVERYQQEANPIGEDVQIDFELLPLFKDQFKKVDWPSLSNADRMSLLDEHVANMRKKVERYGEVNLTAIQEFEEVEKRHGFLTEQKEDLEKSIQILESAIIRIDETTKTRFAETFEGVNEKFKEVFPILFNGGKAELSLTEPTNVLDSGVDIMVQPPGKRLQSISLLSGGEKALTAVSLVLAIFARKPSPFCLLDEVDAPLDDANVSRFNTVVRHMSTKSQFILITHNRRTMEMADALYGVTMERAGVSKMTSVQLH